MKRIINSHRIWFYLYWCWRWNSNKAIIIQTLKGSTSRKCKTVRKKSYGDNFPIAWSDFASSYFRVERQETPLITFVFPEYLRKHLAKERHWKLHHGRILSHHDITSVHSSQQRKLTLKRFSIGHIAHGLNLPSDNSLIHKLNINISQVIKCPWSNH